MKDKVNLLDMKFKSLSLEEKRAALVVMDVMLKKLHENGYMVTNFNPDHIYFQDGIYSFDKIVPISYIVADNREEAILNNVIWMSVLALWAYYNNTSDTLMNPKFVSQHFDSFSFCYPNADKAYYQSILVDSYHSNKLVAPFIYLSDYVISEHKKNSTSNASSLAYVKATEAGKAFSDKNEAAFGYNFFLVTVVASITIILIGIVFYILVV